MGHSLWCNMPGEQSDNISKVVGVLLDGRAMSHGMNLLVVAEYCRCEMKS